MSDKIKLLYVDDEVMNLQLFKFNFQKYFDIVTGLNASQGIKELINNPDTKIVITDMRMPGKSGLEFIKEARSEFKDVQYFILTGYETDVEIRNAINQKWVEQCFKKPFDKKLLLDALLSV